MSKEDHNEDCGIKKFSPSKGDVLLELKGQKTQEFGKTFVWRMIATDSNLKKVWPNDETEKCSHDDVLWAIDSKNRFISLCEECGEFAFGHKTEEK